MRTIENGAKCSHVGFVKNVVASCFPTLRATLLILQIFTLIMLLIDSPSLFHQKPFGAIIKRKKTLLISAKKIKIFKNFQFHNEK